MEQKQAIWCLKRKSLNINLCDIDFMQQFIKQFVIMLIFEEKTSLFMGFFTRDSSIRYSGLVLAPIR